MDLKVWSMQMQHPIEKGSRFVRKVAMRQEIAHLKRQGRIFSSGNIHLPEIALTFDDGPDPGYTPQILDILHRYDVNATFFCIGRQVTNYPHLVRQVYEAGHVIGNHTYTHPNMARLSTSDVQSQLHQTSNAIHDVIGVRPLFFRPPYGVFSAKVLSQITQLGLTMVLWNDKAEEWAKPGVNFIVRRVVNSSNGTIILLHDGGEDQSQTIAALPAIIEGLQRRGLRFVTIQQMASNLMCRETVVP